MPTLTQTAPLHIPPSILSDEERRAALIASFKHITVAIHSEGIHEVVFLGDSKNVIDEWYTYEMFLYTVTQDKFSLRQLFDLRAGVPPIAYFLKKTRQLFAEVPNISRHKVALVYSPRHGSLIYAGISLMNMLPVARGTTRYFREEQYTNALNWLREIKS